MMTTPLEVIIIQWKGAVMALEPSPPLIYFLSKILIFCRYCAIYVGIFFR